MADSPRTWVILAGIAGILMPLLITGIVLLGSDARHLESDGYGFLIFAFVGSGLSFIGTAFNLKFFKWRFLIPGCQILFWGCVAPVVLMALSVVYQVALHPHASVAFLAIVAASVFVTAYHSWSAHWPS